MQQTVGQLLYEGLFALNEQFAPEPVLADAYTYDSESRTWTITLRSGVMFSDGSMLTAQDVAASLARAKNSLRYGARLRCVNSVTAWDGAVVITLSEDVATLPSRLDVPIVKSGTETSTVPHRHRPVPVRQGRYRRVPHRQHLLVAGSVPAGAAHRAAPLQGQDSALYAFSSREIQLLALDLTAVSGTGVSGSGDYTDAPTAVMRLSASTPAGKRWPTRPSAAPSAPASTGRASSPPACWVTAWPPSSPPLPPPGIYDTSLETAYSAAHYRQLLSAALGEEAQPLTLTMLVNQENSFKVSAAQEAAYTLTTDDLTVTVEALPWEQFTQRLADGEFDLYYGECRLTADWDVSALAKTAAR